MCEVGDLDIVRAMVERTQVDLEAGDNNSGDTPLHMAEKGHLSVVQYLCKQGADKEARNVSALATVDPVFRKPSPRGGEVFFASVPNGVFNHMASLTKLKEFGKLHHVLASSRQCHAHWENNLRQYTHHAKPLFDEFTSVEALRWTLFKRKIDVRGWELHLEGLKTSLGASISSTHTNSLLHVCEVGNLDIVRAMVERTQVDPESRDDVDWTPLHHTAYDGHLPVVQYLCEAGADKEARDRYGRAPLYSAASSGHLPVVQYLCEQGADKEARDNTGRTPLFTAALIGRLPVVQCLCEQGADKKARSDDGRTPRQMAVIYGHLPIVQYLLH